MGLNLGSASKVTCVCDAHRPHMVSDCHELGHMCTGTCSKCPAHGLLELDLRMLAWLELQYRRHPESTPTPFPHNTQHAMPLQHTGPLPPPPISLLLHTPANIGLTCYPVPQYKRQVPQICQHCQGGKPGCPIIMAARDVRPASMGHHIQSV